MTERLADHPIDPLFLARWSPRAYDGQPMPEADLLRILEGRGGLRIGALVPNSDLAYHPLIAERYPILGRAL